MVRPGIKFLWRFLVCVTVLAVLVQIAGLTFFAVKAAPFFNTTLRPMYIKFTHEGVKIKQRINIRVNTRLPFSSTLDTTLEIPIKELVTLNLPIKGKISLAIDEPFLIPVTGPIQVALDHEFRVEKELSIKSELAMDQYVNTRLLGLSTQIPIQGNIPIDITLPFDETFRINDEFSLIATQPLNCRITHDFNIPIDFSVKTKFMVDEVVPVPIHTDIRTNVRLTGDLPCFLYLNISWSRENGLQMEHSIELE